MKDYCKTCCHDDGDIGFCDKCFYNHILEEKGIPPTEYEAKPNPMTNADRIHAMTDEELAEFINDVWDRLLFGNDLPGMCDVCYTDTIQNCKKCWLDWLKQEADT